MAERLSVRAQMALSEPNPTRLTDFLGDRSTYRLTVDRRVVFAADLPPLETVFKAMELGLRVTLQHYDGRTVTFARVMEVGDG